MGLLRTDECFAFAVTLANHIHLILATARLDALSRAIGEAHRRYTGFFNARARVTGHLFQGRFGCAAMEESHCLNALRCRFRRSRPGVTG